MMRMLWIVWIVLLSTPLPPTGGEAQRPSIECWSDGRADMLVMLDACPPPLPTLEELPLWLSWYDPAKCYDTDGRVIENINCDSDPTVMAGGTAVTPAMYNYAAACVPEWFDGRVVVDGIGEWHCLDVGGAVIPTYREIFWPRRGFVTLWVLPIDVLHDHTQPEPWWQYLPIEPGGWEVLGE